jgi:hypothetical protein
VSWAQRCSPSRSNKPRKLVALRPVAAHTSRPVSWSTAQSR